MTVLNVINRYRQTETVFKKYDEQTGTCICCESLFEPLKGVAAKHGLVLEELLPDPENVAGALTDERDMTMKLPAVNCRVSSGIAPKPTRLRFMSYGAVASPFIPAASGRVFWRRRINIL
jgi:hypothetical protein